jgi:hypothetical protein
MLYGEGADFENTIGTLKTLAKLLEKEQTNKS